MIKVVLVVDYEHSDTKRTKPLIDSVPFSQCALPVAYSSERSEHVVMTAVNGRRQQLSR